MPRSEQEGAWFEKGTAQAACRMSGSHSKHISSVGTTSLLHAAALSLVLSGCHILNSYLQKHETRPVQFPITHISMLSSGHPDFCVFVLGSFWRTCLQSSPSSACFWAAFLMPFPKDKPKLPLPFETLTSVGKPLLRINLLHWGMQQLYPFPDRTHDRALRI